MSSSIPIITKAAEALGLADTAGSPPVSIPLEFARRRASVSQANARPLKPFSHADIKILLLENVNTIAIEALKAEGYQVEVHKASLPEAELIEKIRNVHVIGIRSKTKLTAKVLDAAQELFVIGCFCIGTNQVDLKHAASKGIAVFNSPFSNSRSVAELVIAEIVVLARQLGDRSNELHNGIWNKVSAKCWEIRGKTLGIVGYGHIGSQLSVLAEAMGMTVLYYDVVPIMGLGITKQLPSLHQLLSKSDFVTLHVPELPETTNMIGAPEFEAMKQGSYLINASRGSVIDIPAFINASKAGKIAGGAIDVFPNEPAANGPFFNNDLNPWAEDLRSLKNVILSPHIGGSTEEAQEKIGEEVAASLAKFINEGSTVGAVNFPEVALRQLTFDDADSHVRVLFVHHNRAGALRAVNDMFASHNIKAQFSDSAGQVAYLIADISDVSEESLATLNAKLEGSEYNIRTRLLQT
ncbi:D-3 phosphoglycerate dehydrogenase [Protomyces lactucae-debilis]|uniref:D-3 phosphoglycerate dehydrogenase n=1 Tax=Protomyces lactucae-debilis TaxID=2754530 RepID=A0A1Y2F831_PROLT|nr:D-3 phosphoglycerate dehydrogenase [Protomyces lactucae-debilis]ORY80023.1 D-3 phosphoglycerate dehydrogenase [Protomyces lactucae-debilis]